MDLSSLGLVPFNGGGGGGGGGGAAADASSAPSAGLFDPSPAAGSSSPYLHAKPPKSQLHEFFQQHGGTPTYDVTSGNPPPAPPSFRCMLSCPGIETSQGLTVPEQHFESVAGSKRAAEHSAASKALDYYRSVGLLPTVWPINPPPPPSLSPQQPQAGLRQKVSQRQYQRSGGGGHHPPRRQWGGSGGGGAPQAYRPHQGEGVMGQQQQQQRSGDGWNLMRTIGGPLGLGQVLCDANGRATAVAGLDDAEKEEQRVVRQEEEGLDAIETGELMGILENALKENGMLRTRLKELETAMDKVGGLLGVAMQGGSPLFGPR